MLDQNPKQGLVVKAKAGGRSVGEAIPPGSDPCQSPRWEQSLRQVVQQGLVMLLDIAEGVAGGRSGQAAHDAYRDQTLQIRVSTPPGCPKIPGAHGDAALFHLFDPVIVGAQAHVFPDIGLQSGLVGLQRPGLGRENRVLDQRIARLQGQNIDKTGITPDLLHPKIHQCTAIVAREVLLGPQEITRKMLFQP